MRILQNKNEDIGEMILVIIDDTKYLNKVQSICQADEYLLFATDHLVKEALNREGLPCLDQRDLISDAGMEHKAINWAAALGQRRFGSGTLEEITNYGGYSLWYCAKGSLFDNFFFQARLRKIFDFLIPLHRLIEQRKDISQIYCLSSNFLIRRILELRVEEIPTDFYPHRAKWFSTPFGEMLKIGALELAKALKGLFRYLVGKGLFRKALIQNSYDAVISSYVTVILSNKSDKRIDLMGYDILQRELEKQLRVLTIGFDYSKNINWTLLNPSHRVVPFEAFLKPRSIIDKLRWQIRMGKRWCIFNREVPKSGIFRIYGMDLYKILKWHLFYLLVWFIPVSLKYIDAFKGLIKRYSIQNIFFTGEYSRLGICTIIASRRSICTVHAIQHGVIHELHPGYIHLGKSDLYPLPDTMFVYGQHEYNLLKRQIPSLVHPAKVVGSIRNDFLYHLDRQDDRINICRKYGLDPKKIILVFFSSQEKDSLLKEIMEELASYQREHSVQIVVKIHPRETKIRRFYKLANGFGGRVQVTTNWDTYELLFVADLVVLIPSTLLREGLAIGKKVLVIRWEGTLGAVDDSQKALVYHQVASRKEDFPRMVTQMLLSPIQLDQDQIEKLVRYYYYKIDGKVAERMADVALS